MTEKYEKRQAYEFCELRNQMVRLDVIQVTVRMPDHVHAEKRLVPVGCNRSRDCRRENVRCIVYDPDGRDPCPDAWRNQ